MTMLLTTTMMTALSFSIPMASSPVSLGMWIMVLALLTATSMSLLSSSWLGMLTFLIYVGGLLVMFSYFAATAPNQLHNFNRLTKLAVASMTLSLSLLSKLPQPDTYPMKMSLIMDTLNTPMYIILVLILLLTMIACVKTTQTNKGPLRKFNALTLTN